MAERRMIAKTIVDSDAFLDMPSTAQLLYFHLCVRADDEGFINKPKSIMSLCGSKVDDIKILFAKHFIIPFESGVVVIKHWRIHNHIQNDRFKPTEYQEELSMLDIKSNKSYTENTRYYAENPENVSKMDTLDTQVSIGKDRLIKKEEIERKEEKPPERKHFEKPTIDQVRDYMNELSCNVAEADSFMDHYNGNGWLVGKVPMKDWKATVRNWSRNVGKYRGTNVNGRNPKNRFNNFEQREDNIDDIAISLMKKRIENEKI